MKEGFRRNYQNKRTPWLPRNPTKKAEEAEHGVWSAALAAAPPAGIPGPPSPWRCRARPRCCYRGLLGAPRASSEGLGGGERREEWFSAAPPPPTFTPNPERSGLGGGRWSSWEVRWLLAGGSFPDLLKGKKKNQKAVPLFADVAYLQGGRTAGCMQGSAPPHRSLFTRLHTRGPYSTSRCARSREGSRARCPTR